MRNSKPLPDPDDFNPSAFMRARRPELFSDSETLVEPQLSREVFEYQLQTLTNRKQEIEFEHFCRKLSEKEICPNLVVQTGPTGGGDSKVDTETYPVADEIALRWYEGIGREAAQERWAFAFSAKEKWRPKVRADVEKIIRTKRGYKLIWFMTNQFVKDKDRASVEDTLTKKYGVPIRICDRQWITNAVFEHKRIKLAIDALRLTGFEEKAGERRGPRDSERQIELETLEQQITDPDRYRGVEYQLAEDCLQTALLARHLELQRVEVDGRFQRAEQIANKAGNQQQILRVAYNKAWTAYWWYNDFETLNSLYDQVEALAVGTDQADQLELLSNLWTLVATVIAYGKLDMATAKIEARTVTLKSELARLAGDEKRPNNALYARTLSTLMDLHWPQVWDPQRIDRALEDLKAIMESSEGLGAYPVDSFAAVIRELGQYLPDSASYDSLFEVVVELTKKRTSEAEAGKALLQRGIQKIRAGKNYDAIRLLGRAQQKLVLEEYRGEHLTALLACGSAYEAAGLMWAARASVVGATALAFSEFTARGSILPQTLSCLRRLVWLEIQIGRVPQVLAWIELMSGVAQQLMLEGEGLDEYQNERMLQDASLGILLLRTDFWELKWLDFLPEVLERLGLYYPWIALLYALGYEDRIRSETSILIGQDENGTRELFRMWSQDQAVSAELPAQPVFLNHQKVKFYSTVLGCKITVEAANNLISIHFAETILSVVEAFFATGVNEGIFPHRSNFQITIKQSDFADRLPECKLSPSDSGIDLEITHDDKLDYHTKDERLAFRSWLIELLAKLIPRIFLVSDFDLYLTQLSQDAGFNRALENADVSIALTNILGGTPKFREFLSNVVYGRSQAAIL